MGRSYKSPLREEQARRTRATVLQAAREVFAERGYAATTVPEIARRAGVAVDTVYAAVGKKPVLFRLLIETAISGTDDVVEAERRDYVVRIRQAGSAREKLAIYASAIRTILERFAPLFVVLRDAAGQDAELDALWREISERRAANMLLFAQDVAATGELRAGVTVEELADVVWSTAAPDFYVLLVTERGWSAERFERWLADSWTRLFVGEVW
ncbi:TetR/AcrR family transcriptional regulator [Nonomuraea sp. NPDC050556]|uniref:TetR/AcrR family transcriptional regulator n=1 Tax=Nonomuraea sp. NPDC050556 TaxID=3364369 RepID=UPI0037994407